MKQNTELQWPRTTLVLLGLLTLSLYVLQYWTLPKYSEVSLNIVSFEVFWQVVTHVVQPGWEDAILFSLPALCFAGLVGCEIRRREFTGLLALCFRSARATWLLLLASALIITRYYFSVGEANWLGDGSAPPATRVWPIPISRPWKFALTAA